MSQPFWGVDHLSLIFIRKWHHEKVFVACWDTPRWSMTRPLFPSPVGWNHERVPIFLFPYTGSWLSTLALSMFSWRHWVVESYLLKQIGETGIVSAILLLGKCGKPGPCWCFVGCKCVERWSAIMRTDRSDRSGRRRPIDLDSICIGWILWRLVNLCEFSCFLLGFDMVETSTGLSCPWEVAVKNLATAEAQ